MRLTTIWTMRHMALSERLRRTSDLAWRAIAVRLPARLRYHVLISCGARAIRGNEVVPEVTFMEVLSRTPGDRDGTSA